MNLIIFAAVILVGSAVAAPTNIDDDDETMTISREYFPQQFVKYEGSHDIVSLAIPINLLNLEDSSESESDEDEREAVVFFVEADTDEIGKRTYHGLYSLKDGKVKKILENGRDIAATADKNRIVYFAASDGLYTYKEDDQTAVKYGSLGDSIVGVAHTAEGDGLYILTEDNTVYEVKNNGNEKVKLDGIVDAQQIILDYANNLYFSTPEKKVYVKTTEGINHIEGLPENAAKVTLIKPPFIIEDGLPVVVDNVAYIVFSNGTSKHSGFEFENDAIPSAFGMEATLIQYHAFEKKIYEYNILLLVLGEILNKLKTFLSDKSDQIHNLALNRRASLRS